MKMYELWNWIGEQHDWHHRREIEILDAGTDENGFIPIEEPKDYNPNDKPF